MMTGRPHDAGDGQLSLAHPDLIPGDQVRFPYRGGWGFGVLVGFDGRDAVVAAGQDATRRRVPAATVTPWPPER